MIDIGANLTHESFHKDLPKCLERARVAGIEKIIVTASSIQESIKCVELTQIYSQYLYATVGVHPHLAINWGPESAEEIRQISQAKGVVALGEMGLDFNRNYSPHESQLEAFRAQLDIATELDMPVFMHQRDAHDLFYGVLMDYEGRIKNGVVHCFTDNREALRAYLNMGLYIGITGWICDERRGESLRALVEYIPLDRIMIETDAPYLLPRNLPLDLVGDLNNKPKSRRNEPAYLPHIANTVAQCMKVAPHTLIEASTENAKTFFAI